MTEEAISAFCRAKIAHFKVPRYVRFDDDVPTTGTGKIQKFVMRERMIEELGLRVQVDLPCVTSSHPDFIPCDGLRRILTEQVDLLDQRIDLLVKSRTVLTGFLAKA